MNKQQEEQLVNSLNRYIAICKHQQYVISNKTAQIRMFRVRLLKIRNSIDYLLEHPFSKDNSYLALPHKRDSRHKHYKK